MALPIAETPILTGKDAKRFENEIENVKPVTQQEYDRVFNDYQFIKENCEND